MNNFVDIFKIDQKLSFSVSGSVVEYKIEKSNAKRSSIRI